MKIQSYKNRKIDLNKPVHVYRCLNRKGFIFSIKQGSTVVAHTDCLTLKDVRFHVGESGRNRCLKDKQRNVHAWVIGHINEQVIECEKEVYYNPYKTDSFISEGKRIEGCDYLTIKDNLIKIKKGSI